MRYALDNGCDYVFLLNQDAWIEPETIAMLVAAAEDHPLYGILSPMQMTVDMKHINMTLDDGRMNNELLSDMYTNQVNAVYTIKYANAAGWLLPRKTLETIGGFCPLIKQYGEDDDYIHRVIYHGMKVGLVPNARMVHDSSVRVEGSQEFYQQAQRDDMDGFLDITNPTSLLLQKLYLLRKCIATWLGVNKNYHKFYRHRYHVLSSNYKEIQRCRKLHKMKQTCWL